MPEQSPVAEYRNPARLDGRGFVVLGAGQRHWPAVLPRAGRRAGLSWSASIASRRLRRRSAREVGGEPVAGRRDVPRGRGSGVRQRRANCLAIRCPASSTSWASPMSASSTTMDDAGWDRNFDRDSEARLSRGCRSARRSMPRGGSMVFVSSMAGSRGVENQVAYGGRQGGARSTRAERRD